MTISTRILFTPELWQTGKYTIVTHDGTPVIWNSKNTPPVDVDESYDLFLVLNPTTPEEPSSALN